LPWTEQWKSFEITTDTVQTHQWSIAVFLHTAAVCAVAWPLGPRFTWEQGLRAEVVVERAAVEILEAALVRAGISSLTEVAHADLAQARAVPQKAALLGNARLADSIDGQRCAFADLVEQTVTVQAAARLGLLEAERIPINEHAITLGTVLTLRRRTGSSFGNTRDAGASAGLDAHADWRLFLAVSVCPTLG
jgi:hypothetical protein